MWHFICLYAHWLDEGPICEQLGYVHISGTQLRIKDVLVEGVGVGVLFTRIFPTTSNNK